jgi:glutamine amidotransferase
MNAIGIIDYGMGNLRSVQKAFEHIGAEAIILSSPELVADVDKLILPGVGAFADGMEHLGRLGWIDPIRTYVDSGKTFLGICLGMQLLFDSSQEDAVSPDKPVAGLGVLPGQVMAFVQPEVGERIKIPHMGWNTLDITKESVLLAGLKPDSACYFVHGYYVEPADTTGTIATTQYPQGRPFCCAVERYNILATQFHPEKSQHVGLQILTNFAAL